MPFGNKFNCMEKPKLNYAHPKIMEARHIEEARNLTYQQRFDKFIAIYELSYKLKNAKKIDVSKLKFNE